jgi:hypothetical protein
MHYLKQFTNRGWKDFRVCVLKVYLNVRKTPITSCNRESLEFIISIVNKKTSTVTRPFKNTHSWKKYFPSHISYVNALIFIIEKWKKRTSTVGFLRVN